MYAVRFIRYTKSLETIFRGFDMKQIVSMQRLISPFYLYLEPLNHYNNLNNQDVGVRTSYI